MTAIGNGAHLTGAPRSLLELLRRAPPTHIRVVLVGGGPLEEDYRRVCPEVHILPTPTRAGITARRILQELRLFVMMMRCTRPRDAQELLLVNTTEHEAALLRLWTWRGARRLVIREPVSFLDGPRGRIRMTLLRRCGDLDTACVGTEQALGWASRLRKPPQRFDNIVSAEPGSQGGTLDERNTRAPSRSNAVTFVVVASHAKKDAVTFAIRGFAAMQGRGSANLSVVGEVPPPGTTVEGVEWIGQVQNLGRYLQAQGDVLLALSTVEAFGRAVVEAGLAGLPTIAWDLGGYRDTVPRLGGSLVPPFDIGALAAAMDHAVELGKEALRRDAPLLAARTRAEFDPESAAEAWWMWLTRGTPS